MSTDAIQKFLRPPDKGGAYSDEKLAALLAHAEDGKLSYWSCCCLEGIPAAAHALYVRDGFCGQHSVGNSDISGDFQNLGRKRDDGTITLDEVEADELRRKRLIPLIHAEMALREKERQTKFPEVWEEGYPQSVKEAVEEADFLALRIPEGEVHE